MAPEVTIIKQKPLDNPKTSIIATIAGPDFYNRDYMENLVKEGMSIARVNLAHVKNGFKQDDDSYEHIKRIVTDVCDISRELKQPIGLLFDICGPKIRIGNLSEPIPVEAGEHIIFTIHPDCQTKEACSVTYTGFVSDLKKGDRVFINDGKIEMVVLETHIEEGTVTCKVISASEPKIEKNKGFNLPDTNVKEEALTLSDMEILRKLSAYDIAKQIDFLALSFVREAADVYKLSSFANNYIHYTDNANTIRLPVLIAKIETYQAVKTNDNGDYAVLDQIVTNFDSVMVARGDLAVEKSPEDVPIIQQYLTRKGIEQGKPVIVATQMLLSMCNKENKRPTRPEANDIANAVLNYTDAIMLSEETAIGANASLCVRTMKNIALKAENSQKDERSSTQRLGLVTQPRKTPFAIVEEEDPTRQVAIAESAILLANNLDSPVIVVSTSSGDTAQKMSRYRPSQPIIAITDNEKTANKLLLYRGVYPVLVDKKPDTFEEVLINAKWIVQQIKVNGHTLIQPENGIKVVVPLTLGIEPGIERSVATPGNTNTMYLLEFP